MIPGLGVPGEDLARLTGVLAEVGNEERQCQGLLPLSSPSLLFPAAQGI